MRTINPKTCSSRGHQCSSIHPRRMRSVWVERLLQRTHMALQERIALLNASTCRPKPRSARSALPRPSINYPFNFRHRRATHFSSKGVVDGPLHFSLFFLFSATLVSLSIPPPPPSPVPLPPVCFMVPDIVPNRS